MPPLVEGVMVDFITGRKKYQQRLRLR